MRCTCFLQIDDFLSYCFHSLSKISIPLCFDKVLFSSSLFCLKIQFTDLSIDVKVYLITEKSDLVDSIWPTISIFENLLQIYLLTYSHQTLSFAHFGVLIEHQSLSISSELKNVYILPLFFTFFRLSMSQWIFRHPLNYRNRYRNIIKSEVREATWK